jgi:hypothetical protein
MRCRVSLLGFEAGSYEQHRKKPAKQRLPDPIATKDRRKRQRSRQFGGGSKAAISSSMGPGAQQRLPACVMSFAYWNPRLLKQTNLINVQTGASDADHRPRAGTRKRIRSRRVGRGMDAL